LQRKRRRIGEPPLHPVINKEHTAYRFLVFVVSNLSIPCTYPVVWFFVLAETFSSYIYKVLKQVHPGKKQRMHRPSCDALNAILPRNSVTVETGISKKAMSIMNSFVNDTFDRMAGEAVRLARWVCIEQQLVDLMPFVPPMAFLRM
jgi:hypothetical protein